MQKNPFLMGSREGSIICRRKKYILKEKKLGANTKFVPEQKTTQQDKR